MSEYLSEESLCVLERHASRQKKDGLHSGGFSLKDLSALLLEVRERREADKQLVARLERHVELIAALRRQLDALGAAMVALPGEAKPPDLTQS